MEAFFRTHAYLVEHTNAPVRRILMDEIDWSSRMIGIKGMRGVGKTTFLLQYAKENFAPDDRRCLYVNMNNFYFQAHGISEFAQDFVNQGGKVLLVDQVFKYPNWDTELRYCYYKFPDLHIVFTGSSVMRLKDKSCAVSQIVDMYYLRGFSFREYVNLKAGTRIKPCTLADLTDHHRDIEMEIRQKVNPDTFFTDYLHHGFYPFFREHRNYSENLLKTMNMMIEVDILFIKQIELKYLARIKKLFCQVALNGPKSPNISSLAEEVETSRATVMNYIKYLADARLINILYPVGEEFPRKPSKVMMHNSNLIYAIYPIQTRIQDVMETFFVNALWKDHKVNFGGHEHLYTIDGEQKFRVVDAEDHRIHLKPDTLAASYNTSPGYTQGIPLWLMGYLY